MKKRSTEFDRDAIERIIGTADATAKRVIASAVQSDEILELCLRYGNDSGYVKDAHHNYDVDQGALEIAAAGYIEGAFHLGLAVMYHMLQDGRKGA